MIFDDIGAEEGRHKRCREIHQGDEGDDFHHGRISLGNVCHEFHLLRGLVLECRRLAREMRLDQHFPVRGDAPHQPRPRRLHFGVVHSVLELAREVDDAVAAALSKWEVRVGQEAFVVCRKRRQNLCVRLEDHYCFVGLVFIELYILDIVGCIFRFDLFAPRAIDGIAGLSSISK